MHVCKLRHSPLHLPHKKCIQKVFQVLKRKKAKRGRAVGGRRRPSSAVSKGFSQLIWARRKNNSAAERAVHSVAHHTARRRTPPPPPPNRWHGMKKSSWSKSISAATPHQIFDNNKSIYS